MNLNFKFNSGKISILKKECFFLILFFFLLSSCGVLKNAGIEKRKYRPGFFIESSSRNIIHTEKLTVDNNCEPSLYCLRNIQVSDNDVNSTVQKNRNESLKLNIKKIKKSVLTKTQRSKFKDSKIENFYSNKNHEVYIKNNHNASIQPTKPDGKNYTFSQVIFFIVAILLYFGILHLMILLFPIMSFAIALALSFLIWIPIFIVIALLLLMLKAKIDEKYPNVLK